jgi:uncharacterized protein YqeY
MSTPTPQQRIEADVKTAMKERRKEELSTLRMLLGDLKNKKIELGRDVQEDEFMAIVRRSVKQRQDAAQQYRDGDRQELAEKEEREAETLGGYLPAAPSDDEIRAAITEFVTSENLSGPAAMGKVMPAMIQRFEGRADNATISRIAREVL